MPIAPAIEIGWRLAANVWGKGLATEGARAVLRAGFDEMGLVRVVSFTTADNIASRRVMEKIGLVRDAGLDFGHPDLAEGHKLHRHVVYAAQRETWLQSAAAAVGVGASETHPGQN